MSRKIILQNIYLYERKHLRSFSHFSFMARTYICIQDFFSNSEANASELQENLEEMCRGY